MLCLKFENVKIKELVPVTVVPAFIFSTALLTMVLLLLSVLDAGVKICFAQQSDSHYQCCYSAIYRLSAILPLASRHQRLHASFISAVRQLSAMLLQKFRRNNDSLKHPVAAVILSRMDYCNFSAYQSKDYRS